MRFFVSFLTIAFVSWSANTYAGGGGGCTPTTCTAQGFNCGLASDGCPGDPLLDCGACPPGQACGGGPGVIGGLPNMCFSCTPLTCTSFGANCGVYGDNCGGTLNCGTCTLPQTCGGGLSPVQCGCTPVTCLAGTNCGTISDGCGNTVSCGPICTLPQACGGGGIPNVCGTPASSGGVYRDPVPIGGIGNTIAFDVNNTGVIVGNQEGFSLGTAVVWVPTDNYFNPITLPLPINIFFANTQGINSFGQVVGSGTGFTIEDSFIWTPTNGVYGQPSIVTASGVLLTDINDSGLIIASTDTSAYFAPSVNGIYGAPIAFSGGFAKSVNNAGLVVGAANVNGSPVPTLWTPATDGTYGNPTQFSSGFFVGRANPQKINNSNQIVGFATGGEALFWPTPTSDPDALPHGAYSFVEAFGINDNGQIVGAGFNFDPNNFPPFTPLFPLLWSAGPIITTPTNAATYTLGQNLTTNYSCPGAVLCVGTLLNGAKVDTGKVGTFTFNTIGTYIVGNTLSMKSVYHVAYGVSLLYDSTKPFTSTVVPLKVALTDAVGHDLSSPALTLTATGVLQNPPVQVQSPGNSNPNNNFRFSAQLDSGSGGYIFNLDTTGYGTGGVFQLTFIVNGDSTVVYSIPFELCAPGSKSNPASCLVQ